MTVNNATIASLLQHRPQSLAELTALISPDLYAELRCAVELGKSSDGSQLAPDQLEQCLQLVILYENRHLPEHERTGFNLPSSCKSQPGAGVQQPKFDALQTWGKD
jgi:hypothetical protein